MLHVNILTLTDSIHFICKAYRTANEKHCLIGWLRWHPLKLKIKQKTERRVVPVPMMAAGRQRNPQHPHARQGPLMVETVSGKITGAALTAAWEALPLKKVISWVDDLATNQSVWPLIIMLQLISNWLNGLLQWSVDLTGFKKTKGTKGSVNSTPCNSEMVQNILKSYVLCITALVT